MNGVGDNLEYDHRYIELTDFFEGESSASMVVVEESNINSADKLKLIRSYLDSLLDETIDIRIYVYNLIYYLNSHDYSSTLTAFNLLFEKVTEYWKECYPKLDEDGMDVRYSIFHYLINKANILKELRLINHERLGSWTQNKWGRYQNGEGSEEEVVALSELIAETESSEAERIVKHLSDLKLKLNGLSEFLSLEMSELPLDFSPIVKSLDDVALGLSDSWHLSEVPLEERLLKDSEKQNDIEQESKSERSDAVSSGKIHQQKVSDVNILNKNDAIDLLRKVSLFFKENEPSSPVPCLLDRTVKLATKDFIGVLEELAPESVANVKTLFGTTTSSDCEE